MLLNLAEAPVLPVTDQTKRRVLPDDAPPGGPIQIVLLLRVQPDVLLLIQLHPVQQTLPVPTNGLQSHLLWILVVDHHLELEVIVKLTLAEILRGTEEDGQRECSSFQTPSCGDVPSGCSICTPLTSPGNLSAPAPTPTCCSALGKPAPHRNSLNLRCLFVFPHKYTFLESKHCFKKTRLLHINCFLNFLTLARYFSQRSVVTDFPSFLSSFTWRSTRGLETVKKKKKSDSYSKCSSFLIYCLISSCLSYRR